MNMSHRAAPIGRRIFAIALLLSLGTGLDAQGPALTALKAACVFNIVKFAEWPSDAAPAGTPLVMCVIDRTGIVQALEALRDGQANPVHAVVILGAKPEGDLRGRHVLYVSGLDTSHSERVVEAIQGFPVLTIGDSEDFVRRGGVVSLFPLRDTFRVAVNRGSARRSGLLLSSRLLSLATLVNETSNVKDH